jgi:hypothetical protein
MRYFCLPRSIVESIQNFPPTKEIYRPVTFVLKDGTMRSDVDVINNEFYGMDETKHKYFEPSDIVMVTEN